MARIAIVGSYGVGLTVELDRVPGAGETVIGRTFRRDHGGKGSNQAVGCVRLGAEVDFLTAIGDDGFGQDAAVLWAEEGVRADAVITDAATVQRVAGVIRRKYGVEFTIVTFIERLLARGAKQRLVLRVALAG